MRRSWAPILDAATSVVDEYPYRITLRQLHYRLFHLSGLGYRNDPNDYNQLSSRTAEGRRQGSFPALVDQTRTVHRPLSWSSPTSALSWTAEVYRRDRTEGQDHLVVLGAEKDTLRTQFADWFEELGLPIVLTRGYGSQSYVDEITEMAITDGRKAVLLYVGDLDPSGEDILRDFRTRCDVWSAVEHIAVREDQIEELHLVVNPGKPADPRAASFIRRHPDLGLVQVEVEAIAPDDLRRLITDALARWWDSTPYEAVLGVEAVERDWLSRLAEDPEP